MTTATCDYCPEPATGWAEVLDGHRHYACKWHETEAQRDALRDDATAYVVKLTTAEPRYV